MPSFDEVRVYPIPVMLYLVKNLLHVCPIPAESSLGLNTCTTAHNISILLFQYYVLSDHEVHAMDAILFHWKICLAISSIFLYPLEPLVRFLIYFSEDASMLNGFNYYLAFSIRKIQGTAFILCLILTVLLFTIMGTIYFIYKVRNHFRNFVLIVCAINIFHLICQSFHVHVMHESTVYDDPNGLYSSQISNKLKFMHITTLKGSPHRRKGNGHTDKKGTGLSTQRVEWACAEYMHTMSRTMEVSSIQIDIGFSAAPKRIYTIDDLTNILFHQPYSITLMFTVTLCILEDMIVH
ncbi:hypothetical protein ACJX0J_014977 [Zea mays]